MKKYLMILIAVMTLLMVGISSAADVAPVSQGLAFSPLNLQGDTLYLIDSGEFAVGVGYTVATYKEFLELRAEGAYVTTSTDDKKSFFGAGVGVNIRKMIEKAGGTWAMNSISPTIGILGLYDATAQQKIRPAVYLSLIKVEF